jgi:hypothetical protein
LFLSFVLALADARHGSTLARFSVRVNMQKAHKKQKAG